MTWLKRLIIAVIGLFVLFTVVGYFVIPPYVKSTLTKKLSETLQRPATIGGIAFNPYKFQLTIRDVVIKEKSGSDTLFSLDELFIDIQPRSLIRRAFIVNNLRIKRPFFNLVRNANGSYNFSDIIERKRSASSEPSRETSRILPTHFSMNNISITEGSIRFFDAMKDARHAIRDMNISVPFISNSPQYIDYHILPAFSAKINDASYSLQGQSKPFAQFHETYLDIDVKDVNIPYYLAYAPVKMNFSVPSGLLDIMARISFSQQKEKTPALDINGTLALRNLTVLDARKGEIVNIPRTSMTMASIEPLLRTVRLSQITVESPRITIRREKSGKINFESLVEAEKEKTAKGKRELAPANNTLSGSEEGSPLMVFVEKTEILDGRASFEDDVPKRPVHTSITDIAMTVGDFSTERGHQANLSLSFLLNKGGAVSVRGPVATKPVAAELDLDLKNIAVTPFQAYFTKKMNINVTDGAVSIKGKATAKERRKKDITATFKGNLLVTNLASTDKETGESFLECKTFSFSSISAGHNPFRAHIDGISISDFYARIIVNPDGSLNLMKIIKEEGGGKDGVTADAAFEPDATTGSIADTGITAEERPPADIKIGTITVQEGRVDFSDRLIKPSFSTTLSEMGGRISGISMAKNQLADLDVRGKINRHIPVEILGKFNPSKDRIYADLKVRMNDYDLSPLTPYSGKYLGYAIEKGKLSFDLSYLIDKRRLDSENSIFIDQLTLGERIESPDATKLPIRLAIALLKDRHGRVTLDIPVSGSLDDPKFSLWRIAVKILLNLIAKAATSPFALLGALFGGGEELSYLEFDYGADKIDEAGQKKIETLVKALYDRPSLRVEIESHVDIEKDRAALRTYIFNKKIKTQKLNYMVRKGQQPSPVDEIVVDEKEYGRFLAAAYKAEKFAKPRNFIGLVKTLPAPEMEKLIMTHIEVMDDDLRSLTGRRSEAVKNGLLKAGRVTADRVFIVEPKSLPPEKKENMKDSRADFRLK